MKDIKSNVNWWIYHIRAEVNGKKIINLLEHIDEYDDDDDRHRLQIPVHILSHHLFNNNRIHPYSTFVISSEKLSHAVDGHHVRSGKYYKFPYIIEFHVDLYSSSTDLRNRKL